MSCEAMQERLTARLSGELGASELEELEAHLAVCANCAAEAESVEKLWHGLALPDEAVPSARMRAGIRRAIRSSGLRRWSRGCCFSSWSFHCWASRSRRISN